MSKEMKALLGSLITSAKKQILALNNQIVEYEALLFVGEGEATAADKGTKLERFIARGPLGLRGD